MWSLPDKLRWWFPRYRAKYFLWELAIWTAVVLVLLASKYFEP